MSTFACGYCGAGVAVQRRGGTISLSLEDAVARVQVGTDKTAAELALKRLKEELAEAQTDRSDVEDATASSVVERRAGISRRLEAKTNRNFATGVFLVAWIVFAIILKAFKSVEDAATGIGFGLAGLAAFPVWLVLENGKTTQVDRLLRQIDEVREKGKEDLAKVDARIREIKARIAKNRAIVDA